MGAGLLEGCLQWLVASRGLLGDLSAGDRGLSSGQSGRFLRSTGVWS